MTNLKLVNDNTVKDIPQCPIVTYELVADLGEDGTKTIYESGSLAEVYVVIDEIRIGELDRPNLDLDEDELKNIETIGINVVLTAQDLEIIDFGTEKSAMAELKVYRVVEE